MPARLDPGGDQRLDAVQVDDARVGDSGEQAPPICLFESRAGDDRILFLEENVVESVQPRPAVGVFERDAGSHLGDVLGRMVVVGVDEAPAEPLRERPTDRGLARAGDAHQEHDHPGWVAWPPKRARIIASSRRAKSERPWLEKRLISASVITGVGTPSSIDSATVQRPSPESATTGAMPARVSLSLRIPAHSSSSQQRTTLP